ncbi:MAG TPA: histidine kinase, partial [Streptosporangiaceae bacterium]|nr:histidine kinase [Streptosporangiaceae bacterium]
MRHQRGQASSARRGASPVRERVQRLANWLVFGMRATPYEVLTEHLLERLDEVRASRQRLVAAQDQERRRIERNIHDGAQQQLVALAIKLTLTESLVGVDEEGERELLAEISADAAEAVENLRDLARGIYPPLLAERGLVAA